MGTNRYQILYEGQYGLCLCGIATASGSWFICYDEKQAKQRVAELHAIGETSARYEELPWGTAWFDDNNWIG